jgi:hypothetical protein
MIRYITAYIAGVLTALALLASAATLTITTTAGDDARLGPAFGDLLQLRNASGQARSATTAEVKTWTIAQYRAVVQAYEDRLAKAAVAAPAAFDPT